LTGLDAAADTVFPPSSGEDWIKPVAAWAADTLTRYGFVGSRLNLIGHSWGAYVSAEFAELMPYHEGHPPAASTPLLRSTLAQNGTGDYDADDPTARYRCPEIDFTRNARFAMGIP